MSLVVLLLLSCSTSPDTGADTADDTCAEAAVTNWNNFGASFLTHQCQSCHASGAPNRYDAPEDVHFDTVEEAWDWADRILARATGEAPSMPPEGGVDEDDRTRLSWWLICGTPGN